MPYTDEERDLILCPGRSRSCKVGDCKWCGWNSDRRKDITCPFCDEKDFDLIGLKHHLENYCEIYKNTISIEEERNRMHNE
jgi:hypothetical protein